MPLLAAGSPLVAGSIQENDMQAAAQAKLPEKQSVRVERAFYFNGAPTKVGQEIELPSIFAREMIAAKKCSALASKPADNAALNTKPPEEAKDGRTQRQGGAHAR